MSNATGLELETSFIESNFKTNFFYNELYALARRLQTLVLTEPNTIPNNPEMGVGIRLYLYNFNDENTINIIKERVGFNINKYMPNNNILDIIVEKITSSSTGKPNGVLVKANIYNRNGVNARNIIQQVGITFLTEKSSNVVSDIYL